MATAFNPFARSKLKLVEPLTLVSCTFNGWNSVYDLEYRASRGAANAGLLANQFKVGKPLVVQGKHVVVRGATLTASTDTPNEITLRVEAVSFEAVLAGLVPAQVGSNALVPATPAKQVNSGALFSAITGSTKSPDVAPVIRHNFGPTKRRILA